MKKTKFCCPPKKILIAHLSALAFILAIFFALYLRFGISATVNGKAISRLNVIKLLEKEGKQQVLDSLIEETLIDQEASKKGIKIGQDVVDAEVLRIETQLKTQNQTLAAALASRNMSQADLEKQIRFQKTLEQLITKTEISQAQIDKFLVDNKAYLPKGATKEDLQTLAKNELSTQANNAAITTWLEATKKAAKISYR